MKALPVTATSTTYAARMQEATRGKSMKDEIMTTDMRKTQQLVTAEPLPPFLAQLAALGITRLAARYVRHDDGTIDIPGLLFIEDRAPTTHNIPDELHDAVDAHIAACLDDLTDKHPHGIFHLRIADGCAQDDPWPEDRAIAIINAFPFPTYREPHHNVAASLGPREVTSLEASFERDNQTQVVVTGITTLQLNTPVAVELPECLRSDIQRAVASHVQPTQWKGTYKLDLITKQETDSTTEHTRDRMIRALRDWGLTSATATYSGSDDQGNIDAITAFSDDEAVQLTAEQTEVIDTLVWTALEATHPGFEINDGGDGEVSIDVATGTVVIGHNHIIEREYEETTL